ncbi:MAG: rRNA maturation RNase YbeY [Candidatus Shikimatogenerans sp. Tmey]
MNKVKFTFLDKRSVDKDIKKYIKLLRSFIRYIFNKEKINFYKIDYIFCNNRDIINLNSVFFKKNKITDVISIHYFYKKLIVGEVYICLEESHINSLYNSVDYKYEILRNIVHGTLHVIGYLDSTIIEKKIMHGKQKYYILKYILKYFNKNNNF